MDWKRNGTSYINHSIKMKEILYILLDNYAEHEIGFMPGAVSTDATGFRKEPKYINKMVIIGDGSR